MRLGGHFPENMQWLSADDDKDFINSVDVSLWRLTEKATTNYIGCWIQ